MSPENKEIASLIAALQTALLAVLVALATVIVAFLASGCDSPVGPVGHFEDVVTDASPSGLAKCSTELAEDVASANEELLCHAECVTLELDCLGAPSPECFACEHEAAICRSSCS